MENDLFAGQRDQLRPLPYRMTPVSLDEFVGQEHLLASNRPLRRCIDRDRMSSCVFYGPAGCGKTALARIIARQTQAVFERLNAVTAGVADVRKVVAKAQGEFAGALRRTILFIDEIHRFNRAQQDALLPAVEDGTVVFIGATTENPLFTVNSPLLSRLRIYRFEPLTTEEIAVLVRRSVNDIRGLGGRVTISDAAVQDIARLAGGDARSALNLLEQAADVADHHIDEKTVRLCVETQVFAYDRAGDAHYDHASALIKSMRGSDPQAAVYYLMRMLIGGEDPMFVARRIVICAAEDVGMADPSALQVATAAAQASHMIGMPEAKLLLAEAAIYVAMAPKSNSVYRAVEKASDDVAGVPVQGIPLYLRDGGSQGQKLGYGVGYKYPHDYEGAVVEQQYLPDELVDRVYYQPTDRGYEGRFGKD